MHVDELITDSLPANRVVLVAPLRGFTLISRLFLKPRMMPGEAETQCLQILANAAGSGCHQIEKLAAYRCMVEQLPPIFPVATKLRLCVEQRTLVARSSKSLRQRLLRYTAPKPG